MRAGARRRTPAKARPSADGRLIDSFRPAAVQGLGRPGKRRRNEVRWRKVDADFAKHAHHREQPAAIRRAALVVVMLLLRRRRLGRHGMLVRRRVIGVLVGVGVIMDMHGMNIGGAVVAVRAQVAFD
jgi:hypothetical protein